VPPEGKKIMRLADGGNLYLQITRRESVINRGWVFRYEIDGKRRDMGLGSLNDVGLAAARRKAAELREQMALNGIDPLDARNQQRAERRQ
jgi:hypothetical protein